MLDASKEAITLSAEKTFAGSGLHPEPFSSNWQRGPKYSGSGYKPEPAKVSAEGLSKYRNIPWIQIIGMRNRLIHGYDNIDFGILYKTVTEDLPPLVAELEKIIQTDQKKR
jgi:hypothetical protein